jgi:hypothetical protein
MEVQTMTDLTDRMRTCAAYLRSNEPIGAILDAADLLIEAADALEKFVVEPAHEAIKAQLEQLGMQPMKIIEPKPPTPTSPPTTFHDPGPPAEIPTHSSRSCPSCGSRANKNVHVNGMKLECPVCSFTWPLVQKGKWV